MIPARGSLALCVCTADRPALLARCLEAIFAGTDVPDQVVVSDDGVRGEGERVCARFPDVEHQVGPRRGICANRNAAVSRCRTSHVSLLDDDALVSADFVARARRELARADDRTLLTGDVFERGTRSAPTNTTFLGFFGAAPGTGLRNINLNASVLPLGAFAESGFDERIGYGYEDTDLCAELVVGGYAIEHVPSLTVRHEPPARDAGLEERLRREATRARFYVTLKRYLLLEGRAGAAVAFLVLAPSSELLAWARRGSVSRGLAAIPALAWALRALIDYSRADWDRPSGRAPESHARS